MHVMVGYDNLIFGSGIDTSGGSSGILPSDPRLTTVGKQEGEQTDSFEKWVKYIAKGEVEVELLMLYHLDRIKNM